MALYSKVPSKSPTLCKVHRLALLTNRPFRVDCCPQHWIQKRASSTSARVVAEHRDRPYEPISHTLRRLLRGPDCIIFSTIPEKTSSYIQVYYVCYGLTVAIMDLSLSELFAIFQKHPTCGVVISACSALPEPRYTFLSLCIMQFYLMRPELFLVLKMEIVGCPLEH